VKDRLKIAVMGGGNNAQTMAADLALAGFEVNLCDLPQFAKNIEPLMQSKQIEKYGTAQTTGRTGLAKLEKVTTDVGEAIAQVDIILIAVPAYGHMGFYEALADRVDDGQIVVTVPGNWGALRLFNLLKKRGIQKSVKIAETSICTQICRAAERFMGPGKVRVILESASVQIAAIPANDTETVFQAVNKLYPQLTPANNVIETSLNNSNMVYHGPLMIMNAGWIEHTEGQFMIYRDGVTPSIGRAMDAVGDERDAVMKKLGFIPIPREPHYEEIRSSTWVDDPCEVGPPSLQHRYITEDIPYGLVPLAYLGDLLNVPTPVCDAMIELSSLANQVNYWHEGLTLSKLGLDGLKPEEILALVNAGEEQRK
jgi:opine dehydrogenase